MCTSGSLRQHLVPPISARHRRCVAAARHRAAPRRNVAAAAHERHDHQRFPLLVAAGALIDRQGRCLLAQRPEGKTFAGLWEFPGGKLDRGEAPEEALVRELREELGIAVAAADVRALTFASHRYSDHFCILMPLFLVRKWEGRPKGREGQALAWVDASEIDSYEMPAADLPLLPAVRAVMRQIAHEGDARRA